MWVFFQLIKHRPKIVHSCDLDTIPPAYLYKWIFRKKLIFDVFDKYAMGYVNPKHSLLYSIIESIEEFYAKKADVLITVWLKLLNTFKNKPKVCSIIMNCPEDIVVNRMTNNNILKLVYTGNIVRNRGLEVITKAIKELNGIEFVFSGISIDKILLADLLKNNNVSYMGLLSQEDALKLEGQADVIIVLYNPHIPINNFAMPNKFLLAMMFGVPTITNLGKEIIEEINCGILVDYDNIDQIKKAVVKLRDDKDYRNRLGMNGRDAFVQKYNWNIMEKELYEIYDKLISN
jgi:glycosyltransferase involved in cell wall biosynthesis